MYTGIHFFTLMSFFAGASLQMLFFSLKIYFRLQIIEQRIAANLGVNFLKNLQIAETA